MSAAKLTAVPRRSEDGSTSVGWGYYRAEGAFRPTTVTVGGASGIDVRAIRYALWARIKKTTHNRSS